jgi:hypothetical protein
VTECTAAASGEGVSSGDSGVSFGSGSPSSGDNDGCESVSPSSLKSGTNGTESSPVSPVSLKSGTNASVPGFDG